VGVLSIHPAGDLQQHGFFEFRGFDFHTSLAIIILSTVCYDSAFDRPRRPVIRAFDEFFR
jgi:hypothetical protein